MRPNQPTVARRKPAKQRAKEALRSRFGRPTDARGYVDRPQANLVPGVLFDQFEADLRRGDCDELRTKFCAIHSSAALGVNTFAPLKERPHDLCLLGENGAMSIEFEKRLPIIAG